MSVTVSLTFDTDQPKEQVLHSVVEAVRAFTDHHLTSVHAYTDTEIKAEEDVVHLVAAEDPTGATSSVVAFIGKARANSAHAFAEEMGGVVIELPIDTDCRTEDPR